MRRVAHLLLLSLLVIGAAACGSSSSPADAPAIHATWSWSGTATSCASIAGATQVSIIATVTGTATAYDQAFPCAAGQGTLPLPSAGSYTVVLSLLNGAAQALDQSTPQTVSVTGTTEVATSFDGVL